MAYLNLGYHWNIDGIGDHNVCVLASGTNSQRARSKAGFNELPEAASRFFDPQLYLKGLAYRDCAAPVTRLATHPWINPDAPIDEDEEWHRDWMGDGHNILDEVWPYAIDDDNPELLRNLIGNCFQFQTRFGVNRLIIPGPLTMDAEADFSSELKWIDRGLEVIPDDNSLPIYATLAISETCLPRRQDQESELVEAIIDQLAARTELNGIYLVVDQPVPPNGTYITSRVLAQNLLTLCYDLGHRAGFGVMVNFVDIYGLLCMAAGAEDFCTGPTVKKRRLSFGDYQRRGGGGALPRFFSPSLIADLLPIRDLEQKIAPANLLRMVKPDQTPLSDSLFHAIESRQEVRLVQDWTEDRNNTGVSNSQYLEALRGKIQEYEGAGDKTAWALTWLQDAERDLGYINSRFDNDPLSPDIKHVKVWREAFESFMQAHGLL